MGGHEHVKKQVFCKTLVFSEEFVLRDFVLQNLWNKMLPRHGIESSVAIFPEELWTNQGF